MPGAAAGSGEKRVGHGCSRQTHNIQVNLATLATLNAFAGLATGEAVYRITASRASRQTQSRSENLGKLSVFGSAGDLRVKHGAPLPPS